MTTRAFGKPGFNSFRALARESDVVITQPQRVDVARGLHSSRGPVIYDLYVPSFVEYPASLAADDLNERTRAKLVERNHREYATAVACGDGFLVASERQKDFVLGALGKRAGCGTRPTRGLKPFPSGDRSVRAAVAAAPAARRACDQGPTRSGRFDRGPVGRWRVELVRPGHRSARAGRRPPDRTTAAVGVPRRRPPLAGFPGTDGVGSGAGLGRSSAPGRPGAVVFADEWVPLSGAVVLLGGLRPCRVRPLRLTGDPDEFPHPVPRPSVGGAAHVCTAGGVLSDVLSAAGAARTVPAHDEAAWAQALSQLAGDAATRAQMGQAAHELAADYTWERVSRPAVALVADLVAGRVGPRERPGWGDTAAYLAVAVENRLRS